MGNNFKGKSLAYVLFGKDAMSKSYPEYVDQINSTRTPEVLERAYASTERAHENLWSRVLPSRDVKPEDDYSQNN